MVKVWLLGAAFTFIYAFFPHFLEPIFPALASEGVWLVGLIALSIGLTVLMLVFNIIEERQDKASPSPGGHH
jgi:hypothetical protein